MLSRIFRFGSSNSSNEHTNPSPLITSEPVPESTPLPQPEQQQQASRPLPYEPNVSTSRPGLNNSFKLLFGGLVFTSLSLLITRRALTRRRIASIPPYYTGSIYHRPLVNGALEAFEALNLATINVVSFGMVATGGVLCALDVNSLEDMRRYVRGGLGVDGTGRTEKEVEEELEEWIVSVLGRKAEKQIRKEVDARRESNTPVNEAGTDKT